jgi:hypothetical protein
MVSSKFCVSWFDAIQSDISANSNREVIIFSRVEHTIVFFCNKAEDPDRFL